MQAACLLYHTCSREDEDEGDHSTSGLSHPARGGIERGGKERLFRVCQVASPGPQQLEGLYDYKEQSVKVR